MNAFQFVLPVMALVVLLSGCGDNSSNPATPATNAAADYAGTLVNSKKTADKTIDVSFLNQAVQLFNTQEGRYPKDLNELVPNYVAKLPDAPLGYRLDYNAAKGEVKVVAQ
jgi:hypothetical protein